MITLGTGPKERVRRLVFEIPVYKVMVVHDSSLLVEPMIHTPEDAARVVQKHLQGVDREHFVGLYLSASNRLIAVHTVSVGTLNSSMVHPREVFKLALLLSAASVIVSHNHPSGNLEPSREDIEITRQLAEAGKILGIPLHDHVIVNEHIGYTSLAERGLL